MNKGIIIMAILSGIWAIAAARAEVYVGQTGYFPACHGEVEQRLPVRTIGTFHKLFLKRVGIANQQAALYLSQVIVRYRDGSIISIGNNITFNSPDRDFGLLAMQVEEIILRGESYCTSPYAYEFFVQAWLE